MEPRIDIVEPGSTIFIAVVSFTSETAFVLFDGQGQLRYKSSGRDQPLRVLQSTRAGLASRPNLLQRTVIGHMLSDKRTFVDGLQTPSAKSQLDAPRMARGISKMQSSERPTSETTRTRLRRLPANWRGPLGDCRASPRAGRHAWHGAMKSSTLLIASIRLLSRLSNDEDFIDTAVRHYDLLILHQSEGLSIRRLAAHQRHCQGPRPATAAMRIPCGPGKRDRFGF